MPEKELPSTEYKDKREFKEELPPTEYKDKREFDEKLAEHETREKRLEIAKSALFGVGILSASIILILLFYMPKLEATSFSFIISTIISALLSIATLILGFVAGSAIDK